MGDAPRGARPRGGTTPAPGTGGPTSSWPATSRAASWPGAPAPIDVYRAIEYTLPGILANRSAELGGAPIAIPDLRRRPFERSTFWDTVPLPDADPPATPYQASGPPGF